MSKEIFLAILQQEYEKWIFELEQMQKDYESMTKEQFAKNIAHSVEKRQRLLKLLSMNLYDIEENSRMELLTEFKQSYGKAIKTIKKIIIQVQDLLKMLPLTIKFEDYNNTEKIEEVK